MPTKNRDHLELLVTKEEMTEATIERLFKWNPPAKANGDYSFTGLLTLLYCKAGPINQQKLLKEFSSYFRPFLDNGEYVQRERENEKYKLTMEKSL